MHRPVLLKEAVELLAVKSGGTYVDGTLGGGGHAAAIAALLGDGGRLLGIDRDVEAVERSAAALAEWQNKCTLVQGNFEDMRKMAQDKGIEAADGVMLDLGVSSFQLDTPERGFSFARDGELDMRMDAGRGPTAADLVNGMDEVELASVIRRYGEEPGARRVAGAICRERAQSPFRTTLRLAGVVEKALGGRRGRIHPATKTFQALRIAVNDELGSLERGLEAGLSMLRPGGRMVVIAFHSLEDRIVKRFFVAHAGRMESLQAGGRRWMGERPAVRILTKKPVVPSQDETETNARSRSARLRAAEITGD